MVKSHLFGSSASHVWAKPLTFVHDNSAQLESITWLLTFIFLCLALADKDFVEITDYLLDMENKHIYNLGLVLGLARIKVETMKTSDSFLDDVISAWLRKEDHVKEMGEPSWTVLIKALKHRRVGQIGIADKIANDKGISV